MIYDINNKIFFINGRSCNTTLKRKFLIINNYFILIHDVGYMKYVSFLNFI